MLNQVGRVNRIKYCFGSKGDLKTAERKILNSDCSGNLTLFRYSETVSEPFSKSYCFKRDVLRSTEIKPEHWLIEVYITNMM
jgi:hypothetical protein